MARPSKAMTDMTGMLNTFGRPPSVKPDPFRYPPLGAMNRSGPPVYGQSGPNGPRGHDGPDGFNIWDHNPEDRGLPDWYRLDSLHRELGDDFEVLAPSMYAQWKEHKAIIDFRKARKLLGVDDGK